MLFIRINGVQCINRFGRLFKKFINCNFVFHLNAGIMFDFLLEFLGIKVLEHI